MNPERVYAPLLESYFRQFDADALACLPSLFVPNAFSRYTTAPLKIFYIGRDTNEWGGDVLEQSMRSRDYRRYINHTRSFLNQYQFLDYNNNAWCGFWNLVVKLHLNINGYSTDGLEVNRGMPPALKEKLDFGYGNTNAVETEQSLRKREEWEDLDKEFYGKIKKASGPFDRLESILRAFSPELVFVFHWEANEANYLEGLNYEIINEGALFNKRFLYIRLTDYPLQLFWAPHPNNLRFSGYSADTMVQELMTYLVDQKII